MEGSEEKKQICLKQAEAVIEFSKRPEVIEHEELQEVLKKLADAWEMLGKSYDVNYGHEGQRNYGLYFLDVCEKRLDKILIKEKGKESGLQTDF